MTKLTLLLGAALAVMPVGLTAKDFPVEFKTLTAREAMSFPGRSMLYGMVGGDKPAGIAREPAAVSQHPLYGEFGEGTNAAAFRLDESKGGKGYDQLIVDLNHNRDLTDDPVIPVISDSKSARPAPPEQKLFGPIPAPEGTKVAGGRPACFAQLYLYSLSDDDGEGGPPAGQLRFMPGWYLEANAEFDGVKRKVGLLDGSCNFRLGDASWPSSYDNAGQTNWYFVGGDTVLLAADGSGTFLHSETDPESVPFFPLLYVGAKPCRIALSADGKTLSVEPWTEPLADISIEPQGKQVATIQLALEHTPGQWQLLQANVTEGKTRVPPGNYRLYACTIKDKTAAGDTLILGAYRRQAEGGIRCQAGATTPLKCGAPLEARVTSARETRGRLALGESNTLLGRLLRNATKPKGPVEQSIQAKLVGAGGETYADFTLIKKGEEGQPAKPAFTIADAGGKQVASGKLEYG